MSDMTGWLVRGVGMALVHFGARLVLALATAASPAQGSVLRTITLIAVLLVAVVWGGIDGINAHRRTSDSPVDLTMVWLKASLVAGVLGGLASWLFTAVSGVAVSTNSLFFEVTSGAAFTILLVFVPATIAVAVGKFLARRDDRKDENPRPGKVSKDREPARVGSGSADSGTATDNAGTTANTRAYDTEADTEVFAPVRSDESSRTAYDGAGSQTPATDDARRSAWQEPR